MNRQVTPDDEAEVFKDALWIHLACFKIRRTKQLNPLVDISNVIHLKSPDAVCTC
jgi:hypothetical protein